MGFNRNLLPNPISYYESQGYRLVGPRAAAWRTTECRFHGGSDSMRIKVSSGAFRCFACEAAGGDVIAFHMATFDVSFIDASKALGAWVDDGRPVERHRPTSFSTRDGLEVVRFEAQLAAVAAGNMAHGVVLNDDDRRRLLVAAGRINQVLGAFK